MPTAQAKIYWTAQASIPMSNDPIAYTASDGTTEYDVTVTPAMPHTGRPGRMGTCCQIRCSVECADAAAVATGRQLVLLANPGDPVMPGIGRIFVTG